MDIKEIERLTEKEVKQVAKESINIKEHNCYFVDIDGNFGYSILVFKNGKHIYYANDYELHHSYTVKEKGKEVLRQLYIDKLNSILFTDKELLEKVSSYDEYKRKEHFLRNYWIMRYDNVSMFYIGKDGKRELEIKIETHPFFNPVCGCYVSDEKIVKKATEFLKRLKYNFKKLQKDDIHFRKMISSELSNHEACITCDATDALSALGLHFKDLTESQKSIVKQELHKQIEAYCC